MGVGTRIVSTGAAVPSLGHARASRPCQARHTAKGKVNFAIALEKNDPGLCPALETLVDPETRSVTVFHPNQGPEMLSVGDTLNGDGVLPGYCISIGEIFSDLDSWTD